MKQLFQGLGVVALLSAVSGPALAEPTPCHPLAKKLEWHMCIKAEVPYKRGLKTETREECATDKVIAEGTCELGDLATHIPEGTDFDTVEFYAIGPVDLDLDAFEMQQVSDDGKCQVKDTSFEPWRTMKFSDAFDKSNSERSDLVVAELAKKNKKLLPSALIVWRYPEAVCKGKTAAKGMVETKSQSLYLFLTQTTYAR